MSYLPTDSSTFVNLEKRYYTNGYAYFGFVALGIILLLFCICAANNRRIKRGQNPYISQYLSPPTYMESQHNGPSNQNQPENVPMYYQSANPNQDAGYYDANGNFVPSNKPAQTSTNNNDYNANVQQAYIPNENSEDMFYQQQTNASPSNQNYTRPAGPPPSSLSAGGANSTLPLGNGKETVIESTEEPPSFDEVVTSPQFSRPAGPPPNRF